MFYGHERTEPAQAARSGAERSMNLSGRGGGFTYRGRAEQMEESTQSRLLIRRHSNQFHTELFLPRPADDGKVPAQGLSDEIDTDSYIVSFRHGHSAPDAACFQGHIDHQSSSRPFSEEQGRQHDGKPLALSFLHGATLLGSAGCHLSISGDCVGSCSVARSSRTRSNSDALKDECWSTVFT